MPNIKKRVARSLLIYEIYSYQLLQLLVKGRGV